jgi:hypothetical protein
LHHEFTRAPTPQLQHGRQKRSATPHHDATHYDAAAVCASGSGCGRGNSDSRGNSALVDQSASQGCGCATYQFKWTNDMISFASTRCLLVCTPQQPSFSRPERLHSGFRALEGFGVANKWNVTRGECSLTARQCSVIYETRCCIELLKQLAA